MSEIPILRSILCFVGQVKLKVYLMFVTDVVIFFLLLSQLKWVVYNISERGVLPSEIFNPWYLHLYDLYFETQPYETKFYLPV